MRWMNDRPITELRKIAGLILMEVVIKRKFKSVVRTHDDKLPRHKAISEGKMYGKRKKRQQIRWEMT